MTMSSVSDRLDIEVTRKGSALPKPTGPLGFGKHFTDHVFLAEHDGSSWGGFRIVSADAGGAETLSGGLQYGLSVFEGLKAWRGADGSVRLFRADAHGRRFAASAAGLCMPPLSPELFVEAVAALVRVERDWCPPSESGALYVRPTIFATEQFLGVRPATSHRLAIVLSPVGAYFSGGARPLRLWAEQERARACPGGVGWIKTGGNYAASLSTAERARARGFDQVLWLDALRHEHLEEVGTMNVFARIGDRVLTPPVGDTVLAGVTRDCCVTLLRRWGVSVEERAPSLQELAAIPAGDLELWGTGTAGGVSSIGEVAWKGGVVRTTETSMAARLGAALRAVQTGSAPDELGWCTLVG